MTIELVPKAETKKLLEAFSKPLHSISDVSLHKGQLRIEYEPSIEYRVNQLENCSFIRYGGSYFEEYAIYDDYNSGVEKYEKRPAKSKYQFMFFGHPVACNAKGDFFSMVYHANMGNFDSVEEFHRMRKANMEKDKFEKAVKFYFDSRIKRLRRTTPIFLCRL